MKISAAKAAGFVEEGKEEEEEEEEEDEDEEDPLAPVWVLVLLLFMTFSLQSYGWFRRPLVSGSRLFYVVLA